MTYQGSQTDHITAIVSNLYANMLSLAVKGQGEAYDGDEIKWVYTGGPALNRVFGTRLSTENAQWWIAKIMEMFGHWKVPITWVLDPLTEPYDLGSRLERLGWTRASDWIGMAVDLPCLMELPTSPSPLTIIKVLKDESLQQWSQVTLDARSYASPQLRSDHDRVFTSADVGKGTGWFPYLGALDGKAVATCGLFTIRNVVGIYWVSTLPEVRKRGFAAQLIRSALQDLATQGYQYGILHSVPAAQRVYQRLGFVECCRIQPYIWTPR